MILNTGFRNNRSGRVSGNYPVHDSSCDFVNQWCRASNRFSASPFSRVFFDRARQTRMENETYSARVIPFKGSGSSLQLTSTMSCMHTSTVKTSCNYFASCIGWESDKQILELFGLADEVKVSKAALESCCRKETCCTCSQNMG